MNLAIYESPISLIRYRSSQACRQLCAADEGPCFDEGLEENVNFRDI